MKPEQIKTLAREIAKNLFGTSDSLIRFDLKLKDLDRLTFSQAVSKISHVLSHHPEIKETQPSP